MYELKKGCYQRYAIIASNVKYPGFCILCNSPALFLLLVLPACNYNEQYMLSFDHNNYHLFYNPFSLQVRPLFWKPLHKYTIIGFQPFDGREKRSAGELDKTIKTIVQKNHTVLFIKFINTGIFI